MCPLRHFISKFLSTVLAIVGQHSSVNPSVNQVGHPLPKTFPASFADKGALPAVYSLVVLEGGELLESSPAVVAGVGLLVSVVEHVLVVGLLEREGSPADCARVGGLSCM